MPILRPELLPTAAHVVFNDGIGRLQNRVRGTIILFQLDHFDLAKMFLQIEQIGNLRSAPAINALIVISHHAKVAMIPG